MDLSLTTKTKIAAANLRWQRLTSVHFVVAANAHFAATKKNPGYRCNCGIVAATASYTVEVSGAHVKAVPHRPPPPDPRPRSGPALAPEMGVRSGLASGRTRHSDGWNSASVRCELRQCKAAFIQRVAK